MVKKFSDFAKEEVGFAGDKLKIVEVLGKEVIIKGYKVGDSKYNDKEVLTLQIELNGVDYVIFTGSGVLINQCEKHKDQIPFSTKIKKVNDRFYSFT